MTRRTFLTVLIGAGLGLGWRSISRGAREVVLLEMPDVEGADRYVTLWVVEDDPYLWVRAENRERRWLPLLIANPTVELVRDERTFTAEATAFDDSRTRAYVNARFRTKYGLADRVRAALVRRDSVPFRLRRR